MKTREILIVGAGIAGCAVALALVKRGIGVTIMTSSFDQRLYHAPFIQHDKLTETVLEFQQTRQNQLSCSRSHEQLALLACRSIEELLESNYLVDRNGNVDIHRCLQEQLKQYPEVEWLSQHNLIEFLTLEQHSLNKADRYKKPACLGIVAYNYETHRLDYFLAKETILATGGASSLFPYSTHPITACGQGIAIAHRAGARLLNMEHVHFHPLGLFNKDRPCFPLPLELLAEGGKIHAVKATSLDISSSADHLLHQIYDHLLKTRSEHLWLDLTHLDPIALKGKFPEVDIYCLNHGFNIVKDLLPIVPVVSYNCGGVAVDRTGQTTVQRLRAIGGVACTGIFWNFKDEALSVLESLTWALACAEDIHKQMSKLAYYFPELRQSPNHLGPFSTTVEEDWKLLRYIMWFYVGIKQDSVHLERGEALLAQLLLANTHQELSSYSIEQLQLFHAIQTAQLIAHAIRFQKEMLTSPLPRASSILQKSSSDHFATLV